MRLLDRHIAREVAGPLLVAVLTFVVLIVGHLLFKIISTVVEHGVPVWAVLRFVAYQVPNAMGLALPVSVLLAGALAVHRLARDNELLPLRAAGISTLRILAPVWVMGLAVSGASFLVAEFVQPFADRRAEGIVLDMNFAQRALALEPGKFVAVTEEWYFLPQEVDRKAGVIRDLKAFWVEPQGNVTLVQAQEAAVSREQCTLRQVQFYRVDPAGNLTMGRGYPTTINLPETLATYRGEQKTRRNMTIGELLEQIRLTREASPYVARSLALELHCRISLAFACLCFSLLGAPFALLFREGRSIGGVLGVILFGFVYYVGMLWARMLGESGVLPPVVAAWLPNAVTVVAGSLLLWRRCLR